MNSVVAHLESLDETLAVAAREGFEAEAIPDLAGREIADLLAVAGRVQRRLESLQVEATVQVRERSEGMRDERLTTTYGCSRPADLVRMLTLIDSRSANRLVRAAGFARRERSITDGGFLPARYPALREAMVSGDLGLDGFLAATEPLEASARRISDEARLEADRQLGALARGIQSDLDADSTMDEGMAGPLPTPEDLKVLSQVLVAYLDPDGAEPTDELAMRGRSFTIGAVCDGLAPVHGKLLPGVAGQLQLLIDSLMNPKVDGPENLGVHFTPSEGDDSSRSDDSPGLDDSLPDATYLDNRTRTQKRHDAIATLLNVAARAGEVSDLGGAAPTLVVSVSAEDYAAGKGWGTVVNTGDLVPMRVAAQTACAGGIQRILFDERGRIVSLGTSGRIFNSLQRRSIVRRDGGCIVPGCTVPPTWCEVHHVHEHADGGPTHTDNGVLLCWFHHRTLHLSHWQVRMNRGVPEIRGPEWWDAEQRWRPASKVRPKRSRSSTMSR
ncbi:hypothetical protein DC31_12235 [Microbacterium sp. CH12i]|uniref:HNH endonuclease signature motif containing protein n=1 Tax=Microbacterium sp. CH12i TaxID=1479651 RepID=UPI000461B1FD|nr:HNH endonuclease signature motif containing protein [Microbacterium sp. CH12i]KDA06174.1 hypothetical protein DC31_12235 [Microbacterium sp. CH12i]